jgi:hypothetical protein
VVPFYVIEIIIPRIVNVQAAPQPLAIELQAAGAL